MTEKTKFSRNFYKTSGLYRSFTDMKSRCLNVKRPDYQRYGGRGITVCEKWMNFKGFYDDMASSHKEGLTLERIDNNGNYEPSNCKWVDGFVQANNRRSSHLITIDGVTKTLAQWIRHYGQKSSTVRQRIFGLMWDEIKALTYKKEGVL